MLKVKKKETLKIVSNLFEVVATECKQIHSLNASDPYTYFKIHIFIFKKISVKLCLEGPQIIVQLKTCCLERCLSPCKFELIIKHRPSCLNYAERKNSLSSGEFEAKGRGQACEQAVSPVSVTKG